MAQNYNAVGCNASFWDILHVYVTNGAFALTECTFCDEWSAFMASCHVRFWQCII